MPQDRLAQGIDFVEVEAGGRPCPDRKHTGAGAGFQNMVIGLQISKLCHQPCQPQRGREVLMADLLFAADGLGWQSVFQGRQCVQRFNWASRQIQLSQRQHHRRFHHLEAVPLRPAPFGRCGAEGFCHRRIHHASRDPFAILQCWSQHMGCGDKAISSRQGIRASGGHGRGPFESGQLRKHRSHSHSSTCSPVDM